VRQWRLREGSGLPTAACLGETVSFVSLRLSPVNLGSRASYRHGGRGALPTDPVVTPSFKALTGEAPGTRSLTEPPALRSTQHNDAEEEERW
jgi:hypothetical protein